MKDLPPPYAEGDIGLMKHMKGEFRVVGCQNPFAITGMPASFENFRQEIVLEVDDECLIVSRSRVVCPAVSERYGQGIHLSPLP